jgi:hypothetical protein
MAQATATRLIPRVVLLSLPRILAALTYKAGSAGADTIAVDVWNQAGVEATRQFSVSITGLDDGSGSGERRRWFFLRQHDDPP